MSEYVFVYGTLAPGESRWKTLAPFVTGEPQHDTVSGELFDTQCGFPAAVLGERGTIPGFTVELDPEYAEPVIALLDRIEGEPDLYQRYLVTSGSGVKVWVYHWPWSTEEYLQIKSWIGRP